jgi:TctA family transporter
LLFSRGDMTTFIDRPISAAFLAASVLLLLTMALPVIKKLVTRAAERRGAGAD